MIFTARRLFTGDAVIEWPRIDVGFDGTVESIETCMCTAPLATT
jgi:hypothetical protein